MSEAPPAPGRPLSLSEAAQGLGISTRSLRRTVAARLIGFTKPPYGRMTFTQSDLDEFLARFHREAEEPGQTIARMSRRRRLLVEDQAALVELAKRRVDERRAKFHPARGRAS